jgi:hypothetical protein
MMSFRGQVSWEKMTAPGGKLTTLMRQAYNTYEAPKQKVNKAFELFKHLLSLNQGMLTNGEGSVQLTSSLRLLVV